MDLNKNNPLCRRLNLNSFIQAVEPASGFKKSLYEAYLAGKYR
tara:strand:+ start:90205 stop:90333 length:129 start_codon:yes stop_codon:yes gene_type:complete